MVDFSGQKEIRGIDIQKTAVQYEEESRIFKNFCTLATTAAREIRWYQKTAGILDSTDTTGITGSQIANTSDLTLPVAIEQSVTRNTSYVRKYFVETPWISEEDIKDSDVDILTMNIKEVVMAVEDQVDKRIWNVMTESQSPVNINSVTSTAAWDAASGQDPVSDVLEAIYDIRVNSRVDPVAQGGVLLLSPKDDWSLKEWIISDKGNYVPSTSSEMIKNGILTEFMGLRIVVSNNVTADYAAVIVPGACKWKSFMSIQTAQKIEEGVGRKVRVWEEGEALLEYPKKVSLISNTQA